MNTFTIAQLIGIVQSLIRPVSSLLDRYFPTVVEFTSEEVHVDVIPGKRRVAPLVSPLVEGHVVESLGRTVNILKPAYVKPKMPFDPQRAFKRAVGERIGGSLTPQQRFDLAIAQDLEDLLGMIIRRKEVMASEAIRLGTVTLSGEKYPTVVVNFQRVATHTLANPTGTDRWNQAGAKPLDYLQDAGLIGLRTVGAGLVDVIMGTTAWKHFRGNAQVEKRLLQLNASGTLMNQEVVSAEGLQFMGVIDRMNLFTYAGWYVDPATGVETEIWPAKAMAMTSPLLEGQQLQGAIQDPKAGLQAMEFFPKMWDDEDPARRWLMVQSAPLVAPQRPDASVYASNVVDAV